MLSLVNVLDVLFSSDPCVFGRKPRSRIAYLRSGLLSRRNHAIMPLDHSIRNASLYIFSPMDHGDYSTVEDVSALSYLSLVGFCYFSFVNTTMDGRPRQQHSDDWPLSTCQRCRGR